MIKINNFQYIHEFYKPFRHQYSDYAPKHKNKIDSMVGIIY